MFEDVNVIPSFNNSQKILQTSVLNFDLMETLALWLSSSWKFL